MGHAPNHVQGSIVPAHVDSQEVISFEHKPLSHDVLSAVGTVLGRHPDHPERAAIWASELGLFPVRQRSDRALLATIEPRRPKKPSSV
jgi:hypothetical protein